MYDIKSKSSPSMSLMTNRPKVVPNPCVGILVGLSESGDILVEVEGVGERPARLLAGVERGEIGRNENVGREVLMVFEKGNPDRPIIIGLMEDKLDEILSLQDKGRENHRSPLAVKVDGERLLIQGKEEIVLQCGQGSIILKKDGKIILKGTNILSRSAGLHRIKGGTVTIN